MMQATGKLGSEVRQPEPGQWVLEGPGKAFTADGQLTIENLKPKDPAHVVLWLPRPFPADFLLEFDITLERPDQGLAIVFFATRPADDPEGSVFTPGLARRAANCRKNSGFWLVACGDDQIMGEGLGRGPHRVRFLKVGNQIRVEAAGRLALVFDDDGQTWGPVWGDGYIGRRQMNRIGSAQYRNLKVYAVRQK